MDDAMVGSREAKGPEHELSRFERLLSTLSAAFIDLPSKEFDRALDDSLARIVATLEIDRSTLSRLVPLTGLTEVTHSVGAPGVPPVPTSPSAQGTSAWLLSMAMANKAVVFETLEDLGPDADRSFFRNLGIKSHVTMPIFVAGRLYGALSVACVRTERTWSPEFLTRLRLLADVYSSALARKHAQDQVEIAVGFERLASTILASLVLARPGDESQMISLGLGKMGAFVGSEQAALWERVPDAAHFRTTKRWSAGGFAPVQSCSDQPEALPWISARAAAGEVVRLGRISELPPEAAGDGVALEAAGVRSLLVVPYSVSGEVVGGLALASMQREHGWPDALTPGISLLAEVFANAHAREAAERRKRAAEIEAAHWRERLAHLVRVHTAGEMSAALAHEINQPLGAIENYALAARRRVRESAPDMARLSELIDKVVAQATRAGDVVARMRSMVQRHELHPKAIDIEHAIAECVGMVKMDCDLRDIEIQLSAESGLPLVTVDEIHLQQVVINLLRNAMEAIEQGGKARTITISIAFNRSDEIQVDVADTGGGIADADLERIFESFYTTKSSGLGIGLAICRKLLEAHGGRLWATQNPGGGALFQFTIPIATQDD